MIEDSTVNLTCSLYHLPPPPPSPLLPLPCPTSLSLLIAHQSCSVVLMPCAKTPLLLLPRPPPTTPHRPCARCACIFFLTLHLYKSSTLLDCLHDCRLDSLSQSSFQCRFRRLLTLLSVFLFCQRHLSTKPNVSAAWWSSKIFFSNLFLQQPTPPVFVSSSHLICISQTQQCQTKKRLHWLK